MNVTDNVFQIFGVSEQKAASSPPCANNLNNAAETDKTTNKICV